MCARGKSPTRLSPCTLLILLMCVCGLAVHFIAEDLMSFNGISSLDLFAQAGLADGTHEHSEDHFVFPCITRLPIVHSTGHLVFRMSSNAFSFSLSPQLPPPNF
jgi:hypothetical protein